MSEDVVIVSPDDNSNGVSTQERSIIEDDSLRAEIHSQPAEALAPQHEYERPSEHLQDGHVKSSRPLDKLVPSVVLPASAAIPIPKQVELTSGWNDGGEESKHALYGFAIDHFLLVPPQSRFIPFRRSKPFDLKTRLRWEKELRTAPLTRKLTGEQIQIGLQAFRNISGFMGNRASGKGQIDHCFKLLRNVMPRAAVIKDEIYCQLCKQLTGNPEANAAHNGWLLLSACLASFPPSSTLAPFLERFVADHADSADGKIARFAASCLASLTHWTAKGKTERKEIPSLVEIESLRDHTTVNVNIWFVDGAAQSFGVTSWTTCADLTEATAQRLGVGKKEAFSLYEISPVGEERRVDPNERVLDLIALWERLSVEKQPKKASKESKPKPKPNSADSKSAVVFRHKLLYKVLLYVPLDDDMIEDLELVYKQAVQDIVHAIVVSPLYQCIQLAAYQLYVTYGPYSKAKGVDIHRELMSCVPSQLISTASRSEIAGRVQQAYAALTADRGEDQISVQQIRLAYLKVCESLRLFGSALFAVHNTRDRAMPSDVILAVNYKGITIVSGANDAVLHQFPYVSIATWGYSSSAFVFVVATHDTESERVEFVFKTKMGKAVNDVVAAYVAFILASSNSEAGDLKYTSL